MDFAKMAVHHEYTDSRIDRSGWLFNLQSKMVLLPTKKWSN